MRDFVILNELVSAEVRDAIIIALVVLGLVVALRLYDRWKSRQTAKIQAEHRVALGDSTESTGEGRESERELPRPSGPSSDEQLIQAVEKLRAEMQEIAAAREAEHQLSIAEAERRIAYANTFLDRTGVHKALLTLRREVQRWPTWLRPGDFKKANAVGLREVSTEEESGQEAALKCVSFVFNDRAYRFEFEENQNLSLEGQSKLGKVRLYEKDELVISIGVVLDVNGEIDDWRYVNVDILKPGVWVADIVLLEQQIELEQEKLIGSFEARALLERAKNLPKPPS